MASEDPKGYRPGFQESETSRAEFTVYTHGDDFILSSQPQTLPFIGRNEQDQNPSLVRLSMSRALGSTAGTFTANVKQSSATKSLDQLIVDDDWVDIVFTRWGEPYHTMRGIVESVRQETIIDGSGATVDTWNISGYDFGKVWMKTPVFFNRYIGENVGGGATLRAFEMDGGVFGNPKLTVNTFLRSFLRVLGEGNNGVWELPPHMPIKDVPDGNRFFVNSYAYVADDFTNVPERHSINAHMLDYQDSFLWNLAQQWSDPQFCELYTDLVDYETLYYPESEKPLGIDQTAMAVIFRDRPFPTRANNGDYADSPWFKLPLNIVRWQDVKQKSVGRSGAERKNAFFAQSKVAQETHNAQVDLSLPLWDKFDIRRHGMRRMDYTSNYVAKNDDLAGLTKIQRERMRDWFMLNAYYYNGTVTLGHSRPDIRIGTRLRIKGRSEVFEDETYYVEGLTHSWDYRGGSNSTFQVTRGWKGSDTDYLQALDFAGSDDIYKIAKEATPELAKAISFTLEDLE